MCLRDERLKKVLALLRVSVPATLLCACAYGAGGACRAGTEPQRPASPDPSERVNGEKEKSSPTGAGRRTRRHTPKAPAQPAQLEVIFKTGLSETELFLSSDAEPARRLGVTDTSGAFRFRLAPGIYDVVAARRGYRRLLQRVDVRAGSTVFNLTLSEEPPPPAPALRSRVVATSEAVFSRFLDPKQTDGVTLEDWKVVREQAGDADAADARARAQELFAEGQIALLGGRYADAQSAFNDAAQTLPGSALAFYGLGRTYLATNRTEQAVLSFMRAIQLNEEMALAHAGLFEALTLQGRGGEARRSFERAAELGYDTSKLSFISARELMRRERWAEALEELSVVARSRQTADVNVAIGDCYIGLKQLVSAEPAYELATRLDPKSAVAHARFGEVRLRQKDYARAREELELALRLDPAGATINRERLTKLSREAATRMRKKG